MIGTSIWNYCSVIVVSYNAYVCPATEKRLRKTKKDKEVEIWKPVNEFYEVSNLGRVRSVDRQITQVNRYGTLTTRVLKGKLLTICKDAAGYAITALGKKRQNIKVHQLVAEHFIGPCPEGMVVDHINFDRFDNRIDNLQYLTKLENALKRQKRGTIYHDKNHPTRPGYYRASLYWNNKYIYLGHFETQSEAEMVLRNGGNCNL
jgi:hypothetical protein